jgi:RHS repeat-associated protein
VYGVTQAGGNSIDSNDVVGATRHPDATTGAASAGQQETVTVNALGQTRTATDRDGSVHTLTYDVLGRVVSDAVTTLGAGVDGAVRRIGTTYDGQGNVAKVTSYDAASGGSIVNEVSRDYNGLGQLIWDVQSHSGAVTSGTPKVQYVYGFNSGGTENQSRLSYTVYPSGYTVTSNYTGGSGLNWAISRVSSLSDSTGTLESYDYLGLGTVVRRAHPLPGVDLTYIKQGAEPTGDAGDQYAGLDRFGRVVDQRWLKTSTGAAVDRFQYGYDENSNRLFRDNLTNLASGELYGYDTLDQVASFQRGTLNGTRTGLTGSATRSQTWDYDSVGNWDGVTTNGSSQTRTANAQNEVTSIGGATTPTYDANGNMTGDETGRQFVYDAWNRLVTVKNSGGTTLETFGYDGLGRRVTRTASGTTTDLYYSADWQVLEEKVGANTAARYVWSPVYVDALVLRDRDTDANGTLDERLWVTQDANWNVTALIDGTGTVVERYAYDPFGVQTVYDAGYSVRGAGSSYAWVYGFQGLRYDATSGLNEARFRWFSPTLGRWVSLDPIRFAGGDVNLYGFVGNNPENQVDPSGLQPPATTHRNIVPKNGFNIDMSRSPCTGGVGMGSCGPLNLSLGGTSPFPLIDPPVFTRLPPIPPPPVISARHPVRTASPSTWRFPVDYASFSGSYSLFGASGSITVGFDKYLQPFGSVGTGAGLPVAGGASLQLGSFDRPLTSPEEARSVISGPSIQKDVGYGLGVFKGVTLSEEPRTFSGPALMTPGFSITKSRTVYLPLWSFIYDGYNALCPDDLFENPFKMYKPPTSR